MSQGFLCDGYNLILDFFQGFLNLIFFWTSLLGAAVPSIRAGVGSYFGCNL